MKYRAILLSFLILSLSAGLSAIGCAGSQGKGDDAPTEGPRVPAYFDEIPAETFFFVGGADRVPSLMVVSTLEKLEAARKWLDELGSDIQKVGQDFVRETNEQEHGIQSTKPSPVDEDATQEASEDDKPSFITTTLDQMGGEIDVAGLENLGLPTNPYIAMYNVGPMVVTRFSVADRERFVAFVERIEREFDTPGIKLEHQGQAYRRYQEPGSDEIGLMRVSDEEAVFAFVPSDGYERFLPYFVGAEKPSKSMADENVVLQTAEKNGFEPYSVAYLNLERVVAFAAGEWEPQGLPKELFAEWGEEMTATPACKKEYLRLARMAPRLVAGFREYNENAADFAFGAELADEIARDLSATVSGPPGQGTAFARKSLFQFGLGIDLGKLVDFAAARATDIQRQPFQCEDLKYLNRQSEQLLVRSGQVPPAVRNLAGFNVIVRNLLPQWEEDGSTHGKLRLVARAMGVLRTSDPQSLVYLVQQFFPMAKNIKIQPDGKPVPLPQAADASDVIVDPMVLMTQHGLAMLAGPDMLEPTRDVLSSKSAPTAPAWHMRVNMGEPLRDFVDELEVLVDRAADEKEARNLSAEDIERARRALSTLETYLPAQDWSAALSLEFNDFGVLLAYRDTGPSLNFDFLDNIDEKHKGDFEALGRVLGEEPDEEDQDEEAIEDSASPSPTGPATSTPPSAKPTPTENADEQQNETDDENNDDQKIRVTF